MKRRHFIIGFGATTVGSAGAVGTGAVGQIVGDRDVNLRIAADHNAYLKLEDTSSVTYSDPERDILEIDLTAISDFPHVEGEGFNSRSVYELDNVKPDPDRDPGREIFAIRNQSDRRLEVAAETVDEEGPVIELYDVTDEERQAIDDANPRTLDTGESVGIGLRVIVPAGTDLGEYTQMVRISATEVEG